MGGDGASAGDGEESALRVAGAWSGILRVPIQRWSVAELRAEASRVSGFDVQSINLISAGRNLRDADNLRDLGLHANSKLLMTRIGREQAAPVIRECEKAERLARIRAAAEAMASRSNEDFSSMGDYDLSLFNQNGEALHFKSDSDRRALVMGLILHAKARKLIEASQYREALEVLAFAEESFLLCDRSMIEHVDNLPFLQIDMVWCLFMLRDIGGLGVAKERLAEARRGLKRAHGANLERLRVLQGGFCPELAIYVRLELLEGVVAFHSGLVDAARASLEAAQQKFLKLQVPDESLVILADMGFTTKEAKRGLRVSGQDVDRAVEFVMEQRDIEKRKRAEDKQHRENLREQRRYGKTRSGKAVDLKQLNELVPLGYDKLLIAEALKQTDNNTGLAIDILTNPAHLEALQSVLSSSTTRRGVSNADVSALMQMGFSRERATAALQSSGGVAQALEKLIAEGNSSNEAAVMGEGQEDEEQQEQAQEHGAAAEEDQAQVRDVEMEDEMAGNVTGDAYEEYDLEVTLEGNAIAEYLSLVEGSSSQPLRA
ncbi:uncharacterized protein LOC9641726 [Selaginella moellendorffii]|uniref:uncharacterized protein LOC9641726 n=1 Tax=Selaginella moellendorffii TaxID=88036 RepID=UPI000D1C6656|nr:uncharacterized protein LOC9641726 [Selaginella moellendorffii]|eukprot:XP_024525096.1 uncharacterized protein LOC9641726 [Selaginella moellendorffii]